ncbi:putative holin-like toxin [Bacillus velezensis]
MTVSEAMMIMINFCGLMLNAITFILMIVNAKQT